MPRPRSAQQWIQAVERRVLRLEASIRSSRQVPVGAMLQWWSNDPAPPAGWLVADGGSFDADAYPLLAEQLGGSAVPDVSPASGARFIIRAE